MIIRSWLRARAMRWLDLTTQESATALRERNAKLDNDLSRLRADVAEADEVQSVLRERLDTCRKNHWRWALASAVDEISKMKVQGGAR